MKSRIASLTLIALAALAVPASAQTLFFDNFDADTQALNASLINWTVSNGTIDVIGSIPSPSFDFYPGNGNYLDLDGSSANAGRIETQTTFSLPAGDYELSFLQGQNGVTAESMTISVGSVFTTPFAVSGGTVTLIPRSFVFSVPVATTGTIVFDHDGGDGGGIVIDNVRLAVVPEAGTFALLGMTSILGSVVLRRRTK